jgi:hypothetical protein
VALRVLIAGVTDHDMEQEMNSNRVGDATVIKIPELALNAVEPGVLYPGQANDSTAAVEEVREFWPGSVDPRTGLLRQSIHAWLVRTPTRAILVDTAAGNDKDRPGIPTLNHLKEPFLDRLTAAGA